jgi:hypothetical protein
VYAYVYTIDPTVPNYEAHFQWDTIVLDYDRGYWLQLGYHSNPPYHGRIFYYEVFDSNGSIHQDLQIAPDTGETYKYIIVYTPCQIGNLLYAKARQIFTARKFQ